MQDANAGSSGATCRHVFARLAKDYLSEYSNRELRWNCFLIFVKVFQS